MGELFYREKQFIYMEQGSEQLLLDCGDYMASKSRIPMHCLENQNLKCIFKRYSFSA